MSEAVRNIIGLRRVQLERELHDLSTRQAQLLHRQEHGYRGAGGRSGSVVDPGFLGPKSRQEYHGAKSFDGDQERQGPDRVPGNLWPTGDDGLQGARGDVEPKGFPEPTGRDGRNGIPVEHGDTDPQKFPSGESCRGLDGVDGAPGFEGTPGSKVFLTQQGDTVFSKSDGPPGPGLLGIPGSQGCTNDNDNDNGNDNTFIEHKYRLQIRIYI